MQKKVLVCLGCVFLLSSCQIPFLKKTVPSAEVALEKQTNKTDFRLMAQQEILGLTPAGMQIMKSTVGINNVLYVDIDGEKNKEALLIFDRFGCGENDKARLYVMKYDQGKDIWSVLDVFVLAGRQGKIESFQDIPTDVTGDGRVDIEMISEVASTCGTQWSIYKQLLTFQNGKIVDLTNASLVSVQGGPDFIQRRGNAYEVYNYLGQERACNPYTINLYTFDGNVFVQGQTVTTTYRYKVVENRTGSPREDQLLNDCVTSDSVSKLLSYIRQDALNHALPSFTSQ